MKNGSVCGFLQVPEKLGRNGCMAEYAAVGKMKKIMPRGAVAVYIMYEARAGA